MPLITAALDRIARHGPVAGAILLAVAIFVFNRQAPLGTSIGLVGMLLLWAKPLIGALRGFHSGLRGEPTPRH